MAIIRCNVVTRSVYVTSDGEEFPNRRDAELHELNWVFQERIRLILRKLKVETEECVPARIGEMLRNEFNIDFKDDPNG